MKLLIGGQTRSGGSGQGRLSLVFVYIYIYDIAMYDERGSKYPSSITHERVIIIILTVHQLCATLPSAQHHRNCQRDHRRTRFFFKNCSTSTRHMENNAIVVVGGSGGDGEGRGYTAATTATARQASCSGRFGAGRARSPS